MEDFFNVNDQKMSPEYLELLKNAQELTTVDIFGDCSVDELSRLNHLQHSWRTAYEASRNGNFHQKELAKIQIDDQMNDDLQNIRQVLNAYEMASVNDKYIEVIL